jgi:hypothetical protein
MIVFAGMGKQLHTCCTLILVGKGGNGTYRRACTCVKICHLPIMIITVSVKSLALPQLYEHK